MESAPASESARDLSAALSALERFVVENPLLERLESRLGRFNVFDALGVARRELSHSNFLAWLLDPAESHGAGGLFLRAFLMDLLRITPTQQRLFSPVKLDGGELRGIEVKREWQHIDLLIRGDDPAFVLAIENKVDSGEGDDQLNRYHKIVEHDPQLRGVPDKQYVFLTPVGDEPSNPAWTVYSYDRLHAVLDRVLRTHEGVLGEDVALFLRHYLRLVQSRFMNDPEIETLCREIYKNHRQAIDLIVEKARTLAPGQAEVADWVQASKNWRLCRRGKRTLDIEPAAWEHNAAFQRRRPDGSSRGWITTELYWAEERVQAVVYVGTCEDNALRRRVIEHLRKHGDAFRLTTKGQIKDSSTQLRPRVKLADRDPDDDDVAGLADEVTAAIDDRLAFLQEIGPLLTQALTAANTTPADD